MKWACSVVVKIPRSYKACNTIHVITTEPPTSETLLQVVRHINTNYVIMQVDVSKVRVLQDRSYKRLFPSWQYELTGRWHEVHNGHLFYVSYKRDTVPFSKSESRIYE